MSFVSKISDTRELSGIPAGRKSEASWLPVISELPQCKQGRTLSLIAAAVATRSLVAKILLMETSTSIVYRNEKQKQKVWREHRSQWNCLTQQTPPAPFAGPTCKRFAHVCYEMVSFPWLLDMNPHYTAEARFKGFKFVQSMEQHTAFFRFESG